MVFKNNPIKTKNIEQGTSIYDFRNELPRCKQTGYHNGMFYYSHQDTGNRVYELGEANKTREIPRLRSGSVRLNNFSSLSFLKL
ncbi:MAG: hypothetical protein A2W91_06265 [Bacteroidetes bacterium GWF2_38_335]|nr:MAG: hypothetical protein A2W91_06265 [Bacteroidetes bacterium GWF2_38_335]HBS89030.1 hypothetical protein [Bacteroidales bacterium]